MSRGTVVSMTIGSVLRLETSEREWVRAHLLGWGTAAAVQTAVLAFRLAGPASLWLQAQFFALAQLVLVAFAFTVFTLLRKRFWPRKTAWRVALDVGVLTVGLTLLLSEDLEGPVSRLPGGVPAEIATCMLAFVLAALSLVALWVGTLCARPGWRWLAILAACTVVGLNGVVYPQGYAGFHALSVCGAALFAAHCYEGTRTAPFLARHSGRVLVGLALLGASGVALSPSNAVRLRLRQQPAAIAAPFVAKLDARRSRGARYVPPGQEAWFSDRKNAPERRATSGWERREDQIVLLIGIDALRADVLADEKNRTLLPALFRLRDEAVWFTKARATGSSTVVSMASIFSGLHYSQLYWTKVQQSSAYVFPHEDPRPRVPELLAKAGVHTFVVDGMGYLRNKYGLARGFAQETHVPRRTDSRGVAIYPAAPKLMRPFTKVLGRSQDRRVFGFVHLMDGHAPYADEGETPFERYLNGLRRIDGELARLRRFLEEKNLAERTTLVVFADHGEAFGEHGLTRHSKSLYEVMVRVPLLVHRSGLPAREVATPVSLIDLGPTLLDLFGLGTPGHMMGESLVPFLTGEKPDLTRPIVLEGRLMRSLVTPAGLKIIHDTPGGTVELFDLGRDPNETTNLFDEGERRSQELLGAVSTFFDVHTYRAPGYEVPYRKW